MSSPVLPSDTNPARANPDDVNPDEFLKGIWEKNQNLILGGFALVILVIVGKGALNYFAKQREIGIEQDYAAAAGPEQLRSFVQAHGGHPLAGAAELRLADSAYASGQLADAQAAYDQAAQMLKDGILAARARLGVAICQVQQPGEEAAGVAGLRAIAGDSKVFGGLRAEAAFHLASLAAEAGRSDEVRQDASLALQADATSPWTQRAFSLQADLSDSSAASSSGPAAAGAPSLAPISIPGGN